MMEKHGKEDIPKMTKTTIVDKILQNIENIIDKIEDEQSFNAARDDLKSYSGNIHQKVFLKNAHIMICNAFNEKSKFDK